MDLSSKSDIINELLLDLRAEFLASSLMDDGLRRVDMQAVFNGVLKRKWSKDIDSAKVETYENNSKALNFNLNRAGIYDALPEALFHANVDDKNATGQEMAKDSMRLKAEEKKARQFFAPLENEIFFQNVEVANNEHSLYQKIYTESLNGLIADFWKIDKHIPYRYAFKLIQLLPFKTKIVGNYNLTAEALQFILGEDVNIDIDFCEPATNEIQSTDLGGILGESYLGSDFVMGSSISGYVASVIINVGPIKNSQPMDFHANGIAERLIKAFVGYFVPMEYDVYTKLLIEKDMSSLVLSVDEEAVASHLGFNSVL